MIQHTIRVFITGICGLLLFASMSACKLAQSQSGGIPVLMVSIDGLMPDYVLGADKHGLKIPNLRRLVKEGSYATGVTGVTPTVTYPSHTTLLTGVSPAKHGVITNSPFDPFDKNQNGWYWYSEDIKAPTLWSAARGAGRVTANLDWPVSVGADVHYNIVQYWRASTQDDHKLLRALSTPGLLDEAEKDCGPYPSGYAYHAPDDAKRAKFIAWLIEKKRPGFLTGYFSALDEEQHDSAPYSQKTFETLEGLDALIGQIREAAEKSYQGKYALAVVSDHGHITAEKQFHLNAALGAAKLFELDDKNKLKSYRAIAWTSGGSAGVMLNDEKDETTRASIRELLKRLSADQANGVERVAEGADAAALNGFPGAAFVVGVRPGYRMGGALYGEILRNGKPGGNHGYLPGHRDMEASFFLAGPVIPASRELGRIDMRDVAPTLAGLLQIAFPSAEGRNLLSNSATIGVLR